MLSRRALATASPLSASRPAISRSLLPFCSSSLHTTATSSAAPLPYPTVPGPTPEPPRLPTADSADRVARKRDQLGALQAAKAAKVVPSQPNSALQKRFWKDVCVGAPPHGFQIILDRQPVRTASKQVLTLPCGKIVLALAMALEWDLLVSAQQALKNHYIPLTSLAARALDIETADSQNTDKVRNDIVTMLMRYLTTDTLLCWAPERSAHDPTTSEHQSSSKMRSLRQTQIATAEPIIAYLKTRLFPGLDIGPSLEDESIIPKGQSQLTEQVIKGWLQELPAFELAAVERGVLATKSLLVAIRLVVEWSQHFGDIESSTTRFGIQEAAHACSVEVTWQTDMWGQVEDTHDVEKEDLARQLGSVILLVS